ncbi:MAG: murein biosynthesis integral membrane protein MurJ [Candidatus Puniceispirillaceae bacterium]
MSAPSLAGAFRQIGGLTVISRILGFLRDIVFAGFLGAGPAADAFLVALKLPNMFRRLTAEGAMANAFVPAYAQARQQEGETAAGDLAGETQTTLMLVLVSLVVLGEIFMPAVVSVLAPGFADTPDRMAAAVTLARVSFPYLPMISLVAFWAAIANAEGRFMMAAAMPILFNLCLVAGAMVIPMATGWLAVERAMPLAVALILAGILQLGAMATVLRRAKRMPRWRMPRFGPAIRRMWKTFTVASAGAVIMQVNLVVDLVLASLLPVGAISWLYFADRLAQLPLGVIGIALGTALLPRLSAQLRGGETAAARQSLAEAVQLAAFLVLPAAVALIIIAPQIIAGLFQHGAFTSAAAAASAAALAAYAIGMPAHVMMKILQPAFYASGRPGFVLGTSVLAVAVNIALSLSLMPVLGHVGLALATSASGLVAALVLAVGLARAGGLGLPPVRAMLRIVLATAVLAVVLLLGSEMTAGLSRTASLAILVTGGGVIYLVAAALSGAVPWHLLRR